METVGIINLFPIHYRDIVSFFREHDNYVAFGKHGLAIIGSSEKNTYEIIGYKEKTNILFRVRINNTLIFYNQKDNFSTFYDNNSVNWLVKFNGMDQGEFTNILESHDVKIVKVAENSPDITKTEKPELLQKPLLDHKNKDDSHSDSSDSKQRANILNRMAKMGQAILPKSGVRNTNTELSDSDFEEKLQERRIPPRQTKRAEKNSKVMEDSKVISNNNHVLDNQINNSQLISNQVYNNQLLSNQISNPQLLSNQLYNPQILPSQMYHPSWSSDGYNQYIIAQNTELKSSLAHISSKLDTVLNFKKTDEEVDKNNLLSKLKTMKLSIENLEIALQNSEKENSALRLKYKELENKVHDTCGDELKNKEIDILENTIAELKLKLQESENNCNVVFLEQETLKKLLKEQEEIIEMQKVQLASIASESKNAEELNETIKSLNNTIEILKLKQKDFEEYFEKAETEKKNAAQTCQSKLKLLDEVVKRHMNEMYQSILDDFQEEGSYKYLDIQKSVARNLKITSFKIIQNCDNIFKQVNILEE